VLAVRAAVFGLLTVMTADQFYVVSLLPRPVQGGSMAPAVYGGHHRIRCDECGHEFPVFSMPNGALPPVVPCPHCGRRVRIAEHNRTWCHGDVAWIVRSPYWFRGPRRWEIVGFRYPVAASHLLAKRVVGLPGETIAIRDGEVYINGSICRKPWPVLRSMLSPLPLARDYRQPRELPCEVRLSSPATNYCYSHPGWDQLEVPIRDLVLFFSLTRFTVGARGDNAVLRIRADDGDRGWTVTFDFLKGQVAAERAGPPGGEDQTTPHANATGDRTSAQRFTAPLPQGLRRQVSPSGTQWPIPIAVSLADRRLVVLVREQPVLDVPYEPQPLTQAIVRPFVIEAEGAAGTVDNVEVMRDVYYLPPYPTEVPMPGPIPMGQQRAPAAPPDGVSEPLRVMVAPAEMKEPPFEVRIAADHYFLLGDDSHTSLDSRYWRPRYAVPAEHILGRAMILPRR